MNKATKTAKAVLQSPQVREVAQAVFTAAAVVIHRQLGQYLEQRMSAPLIDFGKEDGDYAN